MNTNLVVSFFGNWSISRGRNATDATETTTLSLTEDTGNAQMLDGVSPVPNGGDMVFSGTISPDGRVCVGDVSQPTTGKFSFIFTLSEDGSVLGGWVVDPATSVSTAWVGKRA